jgi:hypothetical protein
LKVLALCKVCFDDMSLREAYNEPLVWMYSELRDSGIAIDTCSKGHKFAVVHQCQKFELLFESGALALLDGYPREAVSSFAAALERMFEFYIKIIARKKSIPVETFKKAYKELSKQSERQFGAFCLLYLLETGEAFNMPSNKIDLAEEKVAIVEFRNKVIHQGVTPTSEQATEYGARILEIMNSVLAPLLSTNKKLIREYVLEQFQIKSQRVPDGLPWLNQGWLEHVIDISHHSELDITMSFEDRLNRLKENKAAFKAIIDHKSNSYSSVVD